SSTTCRTTCLSLASTRTRRITMRRSSPPYFAIECTKLALPPMPILMPEHLMEFRAENATALKTFRRSMLQYAGDLNDKIKDVSPADFERTTNFFIETEIVPVMDALRSAHERPGT